jgi:hypothetical protein
VRASTAFALIALVLLAPVVAAASSVQRIDGTKKADRIDAVYGGTDRVTCGKGVDAVTADLGDTISRDCELVSRRISSDSLTSAGAQHQTQVEPSVAGAGTTAVATFQVGRFGDGGAAGIGWSTSTDSGQTWRSGILPSLTVASKPAGDAPRASDPAVAYDAAHATWLIATLVLGSGYTGLGINRSNDGRSWSAPTFAARFASGSLAYDKEWVGCDNTASSPFYGRCYLVYTDIATPRVAVQASRDGGATWGAPVTVTSAFGIEAEGALPLIQPSGALTVVFEAQEVGIYAVRSIDGGATFGLPQGVSAISEAARPFLRAPPLPTAAVDASGRMYVAWADCIFRPVCNGNTIVLSTSTDGAMWSAPTRIPGTGFDSFVPGIAADPARSGRISVVSYIRNYSSACAVTTCTFGVSVTSSQDGGAHWTKPQRLDSVSPRYTWTAVAGGHFVGDYVGATFAGGRFVAVFALASKPSARGQLREYMLAASLP